MQLVSMAISKQVNSDNAPYKLSVHFISQIKEVGNYMKTLTSSSSFKYQNEDLFPMMRGKLQLENKKVVEMYATHRSASGEDADNNLDQEIFNRFLKAPPRSRILEKTVTVFCNI